MGKRSTTILATLFLSAAVWIAIVFGFVQLDLDPRVLTIVHTV